MTLYRGVGATVGGSASQTENIFSANTGSSLVGYTQGSTGAVSRTVQSRLRDTPSLKDFGAVGNDSTDDTAAVQAFADYLADNHCIGYAPAGTYKVSSKINFKNTYGWGIEGAGSAATIFKQYSSNTPVFDLGAVSGDSMYGYVLTDMAFDYSNSQPATNTAANPIRFSSMGHQGYFDRLSFLKGSWGIGVASGTVGPWGQHWDNLNFGNGLTGGAVDLSNSTNDGLPNIHWGRFLVTATNMVGPLFKQIHGDNFVWDALEMLDGTNAQWIDAKAGTNLDLRSLKMELCDYSGAPVWNGDALMYFPNCQVRIGQLNVYGTNADFLFSADRYFLNMTTGTAEVGMLRTELTSAPTNTYVCSATGGSTSVSYPSKGTYPVSYVNVGSTAGADYVIFYPDKNDKLSGDKGNANYTVAAGDPGVVRFETLLTAPRTVALPASNNCFNGLRYRVISYGAVNGANTITIQAGGNTKATLSADKTFVDLEWRRTALAHQGWLIVGAGTLP